MSSTLLALLLGLATAQEPAWEDDWRRVGPTEMALTGAAVTGVVLFSTVNPKPRLRWDKPLPLDEATTGALAARSRAGMQRAERISDGLLLGVVALPVVDMALAAGPEANGLSTELSWMGIEALALASLSNRVVATASGRARPYVRWCEEHGDDLPACDSPDRYRSFFSGHTVLAATAASLTCVHHANVPLYGRPGDQLACGLSVAGAGAVGILRLVSRRHHLSDVLVGGLVGVGLGAGMPLLLHYRRAPPVDVDGGQNERRVMPLGVAWRF